jgi:hypothetical protein
VGSGLAGTDDCGRGVEAADGRLGDQVSISLISITFDFLRTRKRKTTEKSFYIIQKFLYLMAPPSPKINFSIKPYSSVNLHYCDVDK